MFNNLIKQVSKIIVGNENKIKAFLKLLESFGVTELARTGVVSLRRGLSED